MSFPEPAFLERLDPILDRVIAGTDPGLKLMPGDEFKADQDPPLGHAPVLKDGQPHMFRVPTRSINAPLTGFSPI